ncbi:DUF1501 domain-containing protein [Luteolibacter arcticus]|uniref:DUF1501 domain-containing protein n=1 Tax=Luteolibacter arcticus TaxID=1581411 RepID=A0ABT3GNG7_9BACT|nr:DUF1501 domain-containing protein [Luteolibacter arcticus]MCW1925057.1 DUF1501 domain-containing protein [Luteolibacter arcticus]
MNPSDHPLFNINRRQLLKGVGAGGLSMLGSTALSQLLAAESPSSAPLFPNFAPKAKRVIYLYQEGAPSQLDTFDYKPGLKDFYDKDLPAGVRGEQRLTGMTSGQARLPIAPSIFKFDHHANKQDGLWVSELMRHTGQMAGEMCVVKSMTTEQINHGPGITFMQTGNQIPGRPSMGAWMSYGLGSENQNLPTFVVMISQGRGQMQALFSHLWGAGFLPGEHQGVQFRAAADPVLYLNDPKGMLRSDRRKMLDMLGEMNRREAERCADPQVLARVAQYEMAYRMQASVPDLTDLKNERESTLALYGPDVKKPGTYAYNCLMARRMAERGVRFIQLYHRGWDHHGSVVKDLPLQCQDVDQAQAGLLQDLRQRGLLDDTLVVWGGEFGRTVYCQGNLTPTQYGRDHHPRCFSMWLAGGGIQGGITYGATDDFSYNVVSNPVTVHDLHATMLHCMGIDHTRLTFKSQGLDQKLTGVEPSKVLKEILA